MQWLILGTIIIGWILLALIQGAAKIFDEFKKKQAFKKISQEKFPDRQINTNLSLYDRNKDIIQQHLKKMSSSSRYHFTDDFTRDCINDICIAEGKSELSPGYKYLKNWIYNAPAEWKQLAEQIKAEARFAKQKVDDRETAKRKADENSRHQGLLQRHESLITQFNEVAYRKVTTIDDYGDKNWDVLEKEANALLLKIAKKEGMSEFQFKDWKKSDFRMPAEYRALKESLLASFKNHYKSRKSQPTKSADVSGMSGIDFETYIAAVLRQHGFTNIAGTPKTGDQGADLVAHRNNRKIVIQAKRYASTVGNKAVQEVLGAIKFYDASEGWVITNSTFTKAAKELAAKNGVKLIDGYDLNRFAEVI